MEWLQLLKILSDQKNNLDAETTRQFMLITARTLQQQNEINNALKSQIRATFVILLLIIIAFQAMNMYLHYRNEKKIKKILDKEKTRD